jgi:Uma2 family endonuclease
MVNETAVPVEEYLRTTYHPDMEYVGGELVERHVGEYFHGLLQSLVIILLGRRMKERGFRVFTETRVRVSDEPRYRIPDISVMALPHQVTSTLTCPHLVIEILSPDDEAGEMLTKVADYLGAGIPHIWVIDPYKRTALEADQTGLRRAPDLVLATPLVGAVDVGSLFRDLDESAEP